MTKSTSVLFKFGLLAAGVLTLQTQASTIFVGSQGALAPDDFVDWGQLGAPFTAVFSGSVVTSDNGLILTVTSTGGTMQRRDQTTGGWSGNFGSGEKLLWNAGNGGDISISFATAIYGLGGGAQIQSDYFGGFSGTISAFDSSNTLLGSHGFSGYSSSAGDDSAVFVGILSSSPNISRISFTAFNSVTDFAINELQLVTTPGTPTPDSSTNLALLGLACMALAVTRRTIA